MAPRPRAAAPVPGELGHARDVPGVVEQLNCPSLFRHCCFRKSPLCPPAPSGATLTRPACPHFPRPLSSGRARRPVALSALRLSYSPPSCSLDTGTRGVPWAIARCPADALLCLAGTEVNRHGRASSCYTVTSLPVPKVLPSYVERSAGTGTYMLLSMELMYPFVRAVWPIPNATPSRSGPPGPSREDVVAPHPDRARRRRIYTRVK